MRSLAKLVYDGTLAVSLLAYNSHRVNMAISKFFIIIVVIVTIVDAESRHRQESYICRLLNSKFVESQPWRGYQIVYEPISRGRLTIWSGVSTLPASEFECYSSQNSSILLDFANYANKLEWTFYDMNRGATYHGISVNNLENSKFLVALELNQAHSYLDCNSITSIEPVNTSKSSSTLQTTCQDCDNSITSLVNSQVNELIKLKLKEQILDSLYWHLAQLVSSQQYSGPISFKNDFN